MERTLPSQSGNREVLSCRQSSTVASTSVSSMAPPSTSSTSRLVANQCRLPVLASTSAPSLTPFTITSDRRMPKLTSACRPKRPSNSSAGIVCLFGTRVEMTKPACKDFPCASTALWSPSARGIAATMRRSAQPLSSSCTSRSDIVSMPPKSTLSSNSRGNPSGFPLMRLTSAKSQFLNFLPQKINSGTMPSMAFWPASNTDDPSTVKASPSITVDDFIDDDMLYIDTTLSAVTPQKNPGGNSAPYKVNSGRPSGVAGDFRAALLEPLLRLL